MHINVRRARMFHVIYKKYTCAQREFRLEGEAFNKQKTLPMEEVLSNFCTKLQNVKYQLVETYVTLRRTILLGRQSLARKRISFLIRKFA